MDSVKGTVEKYCSVAMTQKSAVRISCDFMLTDRLSILK